MVDVPGQSANDEYERRREKREQRVTARFGKLGKVVLAVTPEPQSIKAWSVGAEGEREVGQRLNSLAGPDFIVMHDRKMPRSRANIDHIVVSRAGVFVVDAKKYAGEVRKRDVGGFRRKDERLFAGSRDCTKLVEQVDGQIAAVEAALSGLAVTVSGVLCFVGAQWPLFGRPLQFGRVTALWPKALDKHLLASPVLTSDLVRVTAERVQERFPAR